MKKLILAGLLFVASTMVGAEIRKIEEQTFQGWWGLRVITGYFDTASEQYCLVVFETNKQNMLMHCKAVHELSEQAQKNILDDSYEPKSDIGTSGAAQEGFPED